MEPGVAGYSHMCWQESMASSSQAKNGGNPRSVRIWTERRQPPTPILDTDPRIMLRGVIAIY